MSRSHELYFYLFLGTSTLASCSHVPAREYARQPSSTTDLNNISPSRTINEVHEAAKSETVRHLSNAKIVMADYPLLRRDFPLLQSYSESQIDEWVLQNAAYVSEPQSAQALVNTPIPLSQETRTAYRPPDYGRALVFQATDPVSNAPVGMIDAKGVGSLKPFQAADGHGNGLATLGESIREFVYEKLARKVFEHSGEGVKTVGTYAIIDAGFDITHSDGSHSPAGIVLRQAHKRAPGAYSLLSDSESLRIERILRRYGLTSAGAYRFARIEAINVQGTDAGGILDFGGFLAVDDFYKPAKRFYGGKLLLTGPQDPLFVHPDPDLRVPLNLWGTTISGKEDPKLDNVWIWSHELADALRSGHANRASVDQHLKNLLEPTFKRIDSKLSSCASALGNLLSI